MPPPPGRELPAPVSRGGKCKNGLPGAGSGSQWQHRQLAGQSQAVQESSPTGHGVGWVMGRGCCPQTQPQKVPSPKSGNGSWECNASRQPGWVGVGKSWQVRKWGRGKAEVWEGWQVLQALQSLGFPAPPCCPLRKYSSSPSSLHCPSLPRLSPLPWWGGVPAGGIPPAPVPSPCPCHPPLSQNRRKSRVPAWAIWEGNGSLQKAKHNGIMVGGRGRGSPLPSVQAGRQAGFHPSRGSPSSR